MPTILFKSISGHSRGQATVLVALGMSALMGFSAMAVDAGYLLYQKRRLQSAADAAAIAGALEVVQGGNVQSAAAHDAALNGFTNGVNGVTLTVNNPPASGPYASQSQAVESILRVAQPTFFMRILNIDSVTLSARSVAGSRSGSNCVYALDPHASAALGTVDLTGSASLVANCGVVVDSDSSSAVSLSGGATLRATSIGIVGGYSAPAGALSPNPITGMPIAADPLAAVPAPSAGATCTQSNYTIAGDQVATINQGTYCGGISVAGGASLTLNPGTYVLDGGGLNVSGGASLSGTGVTVYNTAGAPGGGFEPIQLAGGSQVNLSAPTSGPLAGILFFQDRAITSTETNSFTGGSTMTLNGALYFPTGALKYSGGSTSTAYTILVADTIDMSGASGATIYADYSSLPDGSPIKAVKLME